MRFGLIYDMRTTLERKMNLNAAKIKIKTLAKQIYSQEKTSYQMLKRMYSNQQ